MLDKKEKVKNILILILVFIIGFGVGMHFAFQTVFSMYKKYSVIAI